MLRPPDVKRYDPCQGGVSGKEEAQWWIVFADRDGVPVFLDSEARRAASGETLSFLDRFFVVGEDATHGTLYLVRSHSAPYDDNVVVDDVVGWVKAHHLLLCNESSEETSGGAQVRSKLFIVPSRAVSVGKSVVRTGPSDDALAVARIGSRGTSPEFFHVYKTDDCGGQPTWCLVGSGRRFRRDKPRDVILGWVPMRQVVLWSSRLGYEPYPHRRSPARIFRTETELRDAQSGGGAIPVFQVEGAVRAWGSDVFRPVSLTLSPDDSVDLVCLLGPEAQSGLDLPLVGYLSPYDDNGFLVWRRAILVSLPEILEVINLLQDVMYQPASDDWLHGFPLLTQDLTIHPTFIHDHARLAGLMSVLHFPEVAELLGMSAAGLSALGRSEMDEMVEAAEKALDDLESYRQDSTMWFSVHDEAYAWIPLD
jgi:hypothetical protein